MKIALKLFGVGLFGVLVIAHAAQHIVALIERPDDIRLIFSVYSICALLLYHHWAWRYCIVLNNDSPKSHIKIKGASCNYNSMT